MYAAAGRWRHRDLASPGALPVPSIRLEIVRDGRDHVGRGLPDVAPAVIVEVDRVGKVTRRHELRLSHRAGPRAGHRFGLDVAARDHGQRVEELPPEEIGAARLPRKGCERAKDRRAARVAAEPRLDAPYGEHHTPLHAECALDAVEELALFVGAGPAAADEHGRHEIVVVAIERDGELGLGAIAGDDVRQRLDPDERLIDEVPGVAAVFRLFYECAEPFLERLLSGDLCEWLRRLRRDVGGQGTEQPGERDQDGQTDTHVPIVTLPRWVCFSTNTASAVVSQEIEARAQRGVNCHFAALCNY